MDTKDVFGWLRSDIQTMFGKMDNVETSVSDMSKELGEVKVQIGILNTQVETTMSPDRASCNAFKEHVEKHETNVKTWKGHAIGLLFKLIGIILIAGGSVAFVLFRQEGG